MFITYFQKVIFKVAMKYKMLREAVVKLSPSLAHRLMYRRAMGEFPNLKKPRSFNEKISWLKLFELPTDPLAAVVADKLRVRNYVTERGYVHALVPLLGIWKNSSEIDFEGLPEQFVLKCNHGCGMNLICGDKSSFDFGFAKSQIDKWMKTNWAFLSAEPHYSAIPHRVICEEYVRGPLVDYKFFCFNGVPRFYYVSKGLELGPTCGQISFFYMDGQTAPFKRLDHEELSIGSVKQPFYFDEMVDIAKSLSEPFKFARVDFLTNNDRFYFSEITLTPSAGMMPLEPKEWDFKLGDMLMI